MRLHIAVAAWVVVWAGVCPAVYAWPAQKKPPASPPPPRIAKPGKANQPKENPVDQLERFQQLSPQDREKELSKLPPARRARVEQQLANLAKLTPQQRARRLERLRTLQSLPPARRQAVRQEIQDLRSLPPRLRAARLNGEEMKTFSPVEQQLIRDIFPRLSRGQPEPPF